MSDSCSVPTELCSIYRGDTIPFDFSFTNDDGTALNITGMTLWFTMKLDAGVTVLGPNDIQVQMPFDAGDIGNDYLNGNGSMKVPTTETTKLLPERVYFYDFQLVDPQVDPEPDEVYTVGAGKVKTLQDVTQVTG